MTTGRPVPPGRSGERTSLTWWRTAQTAIACALVLAKSNIDHAGADDVATVLGWIAMGIAVAIAAIAWLAARGRATANDAAVHTETPSGARPSAALIAAVCGMTIALAAAVLAVILTS